MKKEDKAKLTKFMNQQTVFLPVSAGKHFVFSKSIELPKSRKPYGDKK